MFSVCLLTGGPSSVSGPVSGQVSGLLGVGGWCLGPRPGLGVHSPRSRGMGGLTETIFFSKIFLDPGGRLPKGGPRRGRPRRPTLEVGGLGWYGSCGHPGGRSCLILISVLLVIISYGNYVVFILAINVASKKKRKTQDICVM